MASKLMKANAWAKREFAEGSRPSSYRLRRWVENGTVAGRMIDNTPYIFETERAGVTSTVAKAVQLLLKES